MRHSASAFDGFATVPSLRREVPAVRRPGSARPRTRESGPREAAPSRGDEDLWTWIQRRLRSPGEVLEAERLIGEDVVRRNRLAREELQALGDMVVQFTLQNADLLEEAEQQQARRAKLLHQPHRQLVLQELELLVRKLARDATNADQTFDAYMRSMPSVKLNETDERAMAFVRERSPTRPSTALSSSGRSTTCSLSCLADVRVAGLADVEACATALQQAFDEEHDAIMEEIQFVHDRLEECCDVQREANVRRRVLEPSTSDLQKLATKLQQVAATCIDVKEPSSLRVVRLRRLVDSFRPVPKQLTDVAESAGPLPAVAKAAPVDAFFGDPFA